MRKPRSAPLTLFSFQDILTSLMGVVFLVVLLLSLQLVQQIPEVSDLSHEQADQLRQQIQQMEAECQSLETQLAQRQQESKLLTISQQELQQRRDQLRQLCQMLEADCQAQKKLLEDLANRQKNLETSLQQAPERKQLEQLEQKTAQLRNQLARLKADDLFIFNPAAGEKMPWLVDLAGPAWQVFSVQTGQPVQTFAQPSVEQRIASLLRWARTRDPRREYFVLFVRPGALKGMDFLRQSPYDGLRKGLEEAGFELGVDLLGEDQKLVLGKGAPQ